MATEEINYQLGSIPGVASAEVVVNDDAVPTARVWLDGTRSDEEVREQVNSLLGAALPAAKSADRGVQGRRAGLGKGLSDLIDDSEAEPTPAHLNGEAEELDSFVLRRVAVVESFDGVAVEFEDDQGNRRLFSVGSDGSIDAAVISAVRDSVRVPESLRVETVDIEAPEGVLVLATASDGEGRRSAGAAYVDFGRPWALARAVLQAVGDFT